MKISEDCKVTNETEKLKKSRVLKYLKQCVTEGGQKQENGNFGKW